MQSSRLMRPLAGAAVVFGALTVFSGGRALFGGPEAAAAVGNAVPFVLWFNFLAGFAYVVAGVGLWQRRPWSFGAAVLLLVATGAVAIALAVHVQGGAAYEPRTVGAMGIRLVFWLLVAVVAGGVIRRTAPPGTP